MSFEIFRNTNQLPSLGQAWNQLADSRQTPVLRAEWFTNFAETFLQPRQLHVCVVRRDQEICAIAPLELHIHRPLHYLSLIGAEQLFEPSDFLAQDQEAMDELIAGLNRLGKPLMLHKVPADSLTVEAIKRQQQKWMFARMPLFGATPILPISTSWSEFEASLPNHTKSALRRAERKAQHLGNIQFTQVRPSTADFADYWEEFIEIENASWKHHSGTALSCDERYLDFFARYCQQAAQQGNLIFFFLSIDGQVVATQMDIIHYQKLWLLKLAFVETFSQCSPGIILMNKVVEFAFEQKLRAIEFLGGAEKWLQMWNPQMRNYYNIQLYPYSPLGAGKLSWDISRFVLNKTKNRLRNSKTFNRLRGSAASQ